MKIIKKVRKREIISARVPASLKRQLEKAAKASGVTVSDYLTQVLEAVLKRSKD